jgi:hypothetical protein
MNDLMTLAQIAEMAHCSMRHARDVLVRLPGFPEEAPLSTPRNRLWLRSEVRAYVHRGADRIPAGFPNETFPTGMNALM